MKNKDKLNELAKRYTDIIGFGQKWVDDETVKRKQLYNILVEFAGAIEHHLSTELSDVADAKSCPLYVNYRDFCTDWKNFQK